MQLGPCRVVDLWRKLHGSCCLRLDHVFVMCINNCKKARARVRACVRACAYVRARVCARACACVHACVCVCVCARARVCVCILCHMIFNERKDLCAYCAHAGLHERRLGTDWEEVQGPGC